MDDREYGSLCYAYSPKERGTSKPSLRPACVLPTFLSSYSPYSHTVSEGMTSMVVRWRTGKWREGEAAFRLKKVDYPLKPIQWTGLATTVG